MGGVKEKVAHSDIIKLRKKCKALQRSKEKLEENEAMYRFFAEHLQDVIWRLNHRFQFIYVSPSVYSMLGYHISEILGKSLFSILSPGSIKKVKQSYAKRLTLLPISNEEKERYATYTVEARRKDEHYLWVEVTVSPVFDSENHIVGYIGVTRDISQRRKGEELIYRYAFHDPLTDLPNRRLFDAVLEQAVSQKNPFHRSFAVLFLDIDGLKRVNDEHGHAAGDFLLQTMAQRLRHTVRKNDFVARLGGDEFTAILAGIQNEAAVSQIAHRLVEVCRQPLLIGNKEVQVGASIGLSFFPDDADNVTSLIRYADQAMYQAKRSGGGKYVCYRQ